MLYNISLSIMSCVWCFSKSFLFRLIVVCFYFNTLEILADYCCVPTSLCGPSCRRRRGPSFKPQIILCPMSLTCDRCVPSDEPRPPPNYIRNAPVDEWALWRLIVASRAIILPEEGPICNSISIYCVLCCVPPLQPVDCYVPQTISDLPFRFGIAVRQAMCPSCSSWPKAAAERPSSITFVLLLTVYSWKLKAFASTKAAKDISDDVDGLVGHYMVIWVATGHGLGGSVGVGS